MKSFSSKDRLPFIKGRSFYLLGIMIVSGGLFFGCVGKEPSSSDLFKATQPPIANAGPDQNVDSGATVQLDGTKSSDPQGTAIAYSWTLTEKPAGSGAALSAPEAVSPTFLADVDGQYRIQLIVSEKVDQTLPAGVPASSIVVPTSAPDEVVITAGRPGPFKDSGNKLLLDGAHFGITLLPMDVGGPVSLTAEGWVWIDRAPAAGQETLLFGKESVFELVLDSNANVIFRGFSPAPPSAPGPVVTSLSPAAVTLKEWHHLAAVIDRGQKLAYLALDGKISARSPFTGDLNRNDKRFVIGGGEAGKSFLFGMVDDVRVTQDIRYPSTDFVPPSAPLVQENPFVDNFQNNVYGLWHFDETAGSILFSDLSFRTNDLSLVTETGFRPFGRMAHARISHTAVPLKDQSIWIGGGIDESGASVAESELLHADTEQVTPDALISLTTQDLIAVVDSQLGVGDGVRNIFNTTLPFLPLMTQTTITADAFRAIDDANGKLLANKLPSGSLNYSAGQITVTFPSAPAKGSVNIAATILDPNGNPKSVTLGEDDSGNLAVAGATTSSGSVDRGSTPPSATVTLSSPIVVGSVVVTANKITTGPSETPTDNSKGVVMGTGIFGTVDYSSRTIKAFFTAKPILSTVSVSIDGGTTSITDANGVFGGSGGPGIINSTRQEMTLRFNSPITPGNIVIEADSAHIGPVTDDSNGKLIDNSISTGAVNYDTGKVTVAFVQPLKKKTVKVISGANTVTDSGNGNFTVNGVQIGVVDYDKGTVDVTLSAPLAKGQVSIKADSLPASAKDFFDGNEGVFSGTGIFAGTVNYNTGEVSIDFDPPPADLAPVLISYNYYRKSGIADHTATRFGGSDDGKILVAGGQADSGGSSGPRPPQKGTLLLSFVSNAATAVASTAPLAAARRFHTAALLNDNTVLVVGGEDASHQALSSSETFNLSDARMGSGPSLNQARKLHRMINLKDCDPSRPTNDSLLVVGGYNGDNVPLASAEIYDSITTKFTLTKPMATPRVMHALSCLPDGKVLVTGGIDQRGTILFSAEIFDPALGTFSPVESGMTLPRAGHTATPLPNGTVLIVGGLSSTQTPLASAEIYDPNQRNSVLVKSPLAVPRFGHIALPWKNGIVIIGGGDFSGTAISLLEIYFP